MIVTPEQIALEIAYPFECPDCAAEAKVYLRGQQPHLIPDRHCHHAMTARRDEAHRVVVVFVSDEE